MSAAAANTAELRRLEAEDRLPALACVAVWMTTAGGIWALLLSFLLL